LGNGAKGGIPGFMTKLVVNGLEVVHIGDQE
jgi:hypothetical protein